MPYLRVSVSVGVHGGQVRQTASQKLQLNVALCVLLSKVGVLVLKL